MIQRNLIRQCQLLYKRTISDLLKSITPNVIGDVDHTFILTDTPIRYLSAKKYTPGTILQHFPTGKIGLFLKEYTPSGRGLTIQIQLSDGRIYFAPAYEFFPIKSISK
ncbi:MAG: hypothetical protein QM653_03755 [Dysgonomonas sp.]|uniref:hypothetical protein n=1 Tax=Dysgonomonas sp. TaxID=1891233 RepID=UPI0039E490CE